MPIYEYVCRSCGHEFEVFILPSSTGDAECPACHGRELERLISSFAVDSTETRKTHLQQARKLNRKTARDKQMAEAEQAQRMHDEHHHH